jgi:hypothetical protein
MERNINVSNIFTTSNSPPDIKTIPKSIWLTDNEIMKSLSLTSGGIIAVYTYYFDDKYYKDFRVFYNMKDMIDIMTFEIYNMYKTSSLNISDSIQSIILENDNIIIPKSHENTMIYLQVMNSFMTNEVFKLLKLSLNNKVIEMDQKYVRIRK